MALYDQYYGITPPSWLTEGVYESAEPEDTEQTKLWKQRTDALLKNTDLGELLTFTHAPTKVAGITSQQTRTWLDDLLSMYNQRVTTEDTGKVSLGETSAGAQQVIDYFKSKNLPEHVAVGLAANFAGESSFNSGAHTTDTNGLPSGGLALWNGPRLNKLKEFAKQNNKDWRDTLTQLDFAWYELNTSENQALQKIMATSNWRDAVAAVTRYYERPKYTDKEIAKRQKIAEKWYKNV